MAITPQKFREVVFLALYSLDVGHGKEKDIVSLIMNELLLTKKNVLIALKKAKTVFDTLEDLDKLIKKHSKGYRFDRIPSVEKNVLRLGLYELIYDNEIPPKIAISEGIRLTKKFSSKESVLFVNAVLDQVYQTRKTPDETQAE